MSNNFPNCFQTVPNSFWIYPKTIANAPNIFQTFPKSFQNVSKHYLKKSNIRWEILTHQVAAQTVRMLRSPLYPCFSLILGIPSCLPRSGRQLFPIWFITCHLCSSSGVELWWKAVLKMHWTWTEPDKFSLILKPKNHCNNNDASQTTQPISAPRRYCCSRFARPITISLLTRNTTDFRQPTCNSLNFDNLRWTLQQYFIKAYVFINDTQHVIMWWNYFQTIYR